MNDGRNRTRYSKEDACDWKSIKWINAKANLHSLLIFPVSQTGYGKI